MAPFQKAITAPSSPCLQVMTPPGNPLRQLSLRNADKDVLKQLFIDAIRQVLSEMPVEATSSPGNSQISTVSLLTELLEVFQATPSSDATTGPSKLESVGVEEDNHCQLPNEAQGGTPPNTPRITPSEPAATGQPKESTGLLVPSPDDPSAYSTYAEQDDVQVGIDLEHPTKECWPSSPGMDGQDPPSLAKSMDMETECTSGSRGNTSVADFASLAPGQDMPAPPTETEFAQVDLHEWYPVYQSCLRFFLDQSQHTFPVQSLAAFINIRLPCQQGHQADPPAVSLRSYVRRLVVTSQDTPAILCMLFGDDWLAGVGCICKQERLNYLFSAKSGGWASTKSAYDILPDEQTPFLRPLRDVTEEELHVAESRWSEWLAMEDWMLGSRSPW